MNNFSGLESVLNKLLQQDSQDNEQRMLNWRFSDINLKIIIWTENFPKNFFFNIEYGDSCKLSKIIMDNRDNSD